MTVENSVPKGDSKQAVEFLRWFCDDEDRTIQSIHPETKAIRAYTFTKDQDQQLFEQIERLQGVESVYFQVNPLKAPINGARKANKTDVRAIKWLQVDKDPVAKRDHEEERKRIFKVLDAFHTKPNLIIDSGGGGQAFWRLKDPISLGPSNDGLEPWAEGEAYSQQLALELTADACHNCDRIMRLPFTTNMPDAKKRARGRVPALSSVIYRDEGSYPLTAFMKAPVVRIGSAEDANVTGPVREVKLSENIERLAVEELQKLSTERGHPLQDNVVVLIVQGNDPDRPEHFKDRSKAVFYATIQMLKSQFTPDEVAAVITDPSYGISAHVLDQKRPMKYAARQIKRAQQAMINPLLLEMNERFAIIRNFGGKHLVVTEYHDAALKRTFLKHQNKSNFISSWADRKIKIERHNQEPKYLPLGAWWFFHEDARRYDYLVFEPGKEAEIIIHIEGGMPIRKLNLWQGFACEAMPGDCSLYLDHLRENICAGNEAHYNYLLDWMARGVQKPDRPGEVAVVMKGARGAGKSIAAKIYGSLFGRHFITVSNSSHLTGNFNAHMRDCVVIFADEAFYAGDKRHESVLKTLITEDTIMIEAKGLDVEIAANCTRLIMASNNEWVVPAGGDERRFFVLDVGDKYAQDTKYFGEMMQQIESGGREALLHMLLNRDIANFDVRSAPKTAALKNQAHLGANLVTQLFIECLDAGVLPGDRTLKRSPAQATKQSFRDIAKERSQTIPHAAMYTFENDLRVLFETRTEKDHRRRHIRYKPNQKHQLVPRPDYYHFLPLRVLREMFSSYVSDWSNDLTDWQYDDEPDARSRNGRNSETEEIPF
jgi:Family of unknown function (DUF5906)